MMQQLRVLLRAMHSARCTHAVSWVGGDLADGSGQAWSKEKINPDVA